MTQNWIDNHKALDPFKVVQIARKKIQTLEQKIDEAYKAFHKRQKECDHKTPDGKSAWGGGVMLSECSICGCTDY